jgi:hypothetical protein
MVCFLKICNYQAQVSEIITERAIMHAQMLICWNVVVMDRDCPDKFASEMAVESASNIRFLPLLRSFHPCLINVCMLALHRIIQAYSLTERFIGSFCQQHTNRFPARHAASKLHKGRPMMQGVRTTHSCNLYLSATNGGCSLMHRALRKDERLHRRFCRDDNLDSRARITTTF